MTKDIEGELQGDEGELKESSEVTDETPEELKEELLDQLRARQQLLP